MNPTDETMTAEEFRASMRTTPEGRLLVRAGFEPYDTESAARRVAEHAVGDITKLLESLNTMTMLCRLKYGNSDPDVYAEIEKAETLIAAYTQP